MTNREYLQKCHGITYYDFVENHGILSALFREDPSDFLPIRNLGYETFETATAYLNEAVEHLDRQISNLSTPYFLISGEGLASSHRDTVPKFQKFLLSRFSEVRVVSYVRSPISAINSAIQQSIKGGSTYDDIYHEMSNNPMQAQSEISGNRNVVPKYKKRLSKYLHCYGKDQVKILNFSENSVKNRNIIYDFFERVFGISKSSLSPEPIQINSRISAEAVTFLEQYNRDVPLYVDNSVDRARLNSLNNLLRILGDIPGQPYRNGISILDQNKLELTLAEDTKWLAGITDGEIDYTDDIKPNANLLPTVDSDHMVDFLFALTCQLLADKQKLDVEAEFFRAYIQLEVSPKTASIRIDKLLTSCTDPIFLSNAAHLLRKKSFFKLSLVAIDKCISVADKDSQHEIIVKAHKSRTSTLNILQPA